MYTHLQPSGKSLLIYVALLWVDLGAGYLVPIGKAWNENLIPGRGK